MGRVKTTNQTNKRDTFIWRPPPHPPSPPCIICYPVTPLQFETLYLHDIPAVAQRPCIYIIFILLLWHNVTYISRTSRWSWKYTVQTRAATPVDACATGYYFSRQRTSTPYIITCCHAKTRQISTCLPSPAYARRYDNNNNTYTLHV